MKKLETLPLPATTKISNIRYALTKLHGACYISSDECELLINGSHYVIEYDQEGEHYARIDGVINYLTIKTF